MHALFQRTLLHREFPIEGARLPVYLSTDENRQDLLSLTQANLVELARLQDVNRKLEQRRADPKDVEKLVKGLLPTLDGFDRVLHLGRNFAKSEEMDNWLKSVETIYFRLLNLLETYGLFQMKSVGSKVDLNIHEVVEYRPSTSSENDVVISERQKGYVLKAKLLREAKVVVAYNERRKS